MKWIWRKRKKKALGINIKHLTDYHWSLTLSHFDIWPPSFSSTHDFFIYISISFCFLIDTKFPLHTSSFAIQTYKLYDILFATRRSCFHLYTIIQHSKTSMPSIHCIFICVQKCNIQHTSQIHGIWWASMCLTDMCATLPHVRHLLQ